MKSKRRSASSGSGDSRQVGLARALSKLGLCSRSRAFELIRDGKVRLNGSVTRNPEARVRLGEDRIEVAGRPLSAAEKVYWMVNKPRGIVTTVADEQGRDTVYSLLPADSKWVAPVGRLDQASEGLLLFTNDSEWAARITDPGSHLEKTYHVQIGTVGDARLIDVLQRGVETAKGETLKVKRAYVLRAGEKNSWLEIGLDEGKNRHIRRMLDALGVKVLRLIRVAIGPLQLGNLAKGAHRALQPQEKEALVHALNCSQPRTEPQRPKPH